MKRHYNHSNSYEENMSLGWLAYSFRGLVHYHHDEEHGDMHADMVLERELKVLIEGLPYREQEVD